MKALPLFAVLSASLAWAADNYLVYIGTYTNAQSKSQGIYAFRFESARST
jgi:hypothetical protein